MTRVLIVYRAERFSPNSVDRDRAILQATASALHEERPSVGIVSMTEEELERGECLPCDVALCLTMARSAQALTRLETLETQGATIINKPSALRHCSRSHIDNVMRANAIPCAPTDGDGGWWVKRGDEAAQTKDDVVHAATREERDRAIGRFQARGISDIVTTAHVDGDVVKFYGVRHTSFFRHVYASDQGWSKFGDELCNGKAQRTPFSADELHTQADRLALLLGIDVYGGDCIVRPDGTLAIIDFNDWPSFSAFRDEAARAISQMALQKSRLQDKK